MGKIQLNNGGFLNYEITGNVNGENIVFIHSFLWDGSMWDNQIMNLSHKYNCITIDLYGHGKSSSAPNPISMEILANDILKVIDELNIANFHYVGISVGGMLAPYINKLSTKVKSFVIMDSYCGVEPAQNKEIYFAIIDKIEKQKSIDPITAKLIAPMFFSGHNTTIVNNLIKLFSNKLINIPQDNIPTICNIGRVIFDRKDSIDLLKKISVKTTFIVGSYDICRPVTESIEMNALIPTSQIFIIGHAGHICNIENPEKTNEIFRKIFN